MDQDRSTAEVPPESRARPKDPTRKLLRQQLFEFSPRQRQGVFDLRSLCPQDAAELGQFIRERVTEKDGTASAIALSVQTGFHPNDLSDVWLHGDAQSLPALSVCLPTACLIVDLDQAIDPAEEPDRESLSSFEKADRRVRLPLPHFLADELRRRHAARPNAQTIGDLLGQVSLNGRLALKRGPGYRLRLTWKRLRRALPLICIGLGIHPVVAALLTLDFRLTSKSNFSYLTVTAQMLDEAAFRLFAHLGWGEPCVLGDRPPAGSLTTLTRPAVTQHFAALEGRLRDLHPGRHATTETLLAFHNAYVDFCATFLWFVGLSRQTSELDFSAALLAAGAWFTPYDDKATGPTGLPRALLISEAAQAQIRFHANHCAALLGRLKRQGTSVPRSLVTQLSGVAEGRNVPLLASIDPTSREPQAVGTASILSAPGAKHWPCDAGRHYFLSRYFELGMSDALLDIAARHATAGTEHMSSTSRMSMWAAHQQINAFQMAELARLDLLPLPGLSRR